MNRVESKDKIMNYYRTHSVITEPGDKKDELIQLPSDISSICKIMQGLFINFEYTDLYGVKLSENRRDEVSLRYVSKILEKIKELCNEPLNIARKAHQRMIATSRDYAVFLCAVLRSKGIPSRAICGFSGYGSGFYPSYWVCEYWNEERNTWVLVDASLDETMRAVLKISFPSCEVPREKFHTSEYVWNKCKNDELDDRIFGYENNVGLGFIRGNLFRNFVSLNKYEVSPADNWWGFRAKKDMKKEDYDKLNAIASAISGGNETFDEMRALFEGDISIYAPVRTRLEKDDDEFFKQKPANQGNWVVVLGTSTNAVRTLDSKYQAPEKLEHDVLMVEGAKHHNLKNITLKIPKNKLVVFTGVSGSGKSTLVFDTIFAEAQRRFVVGLSPFVRRHLEKVEKPKVDFIYGLSPAIAIEQKTLSNNPRSTVGTVTEISDYLRLLYSRIGIPQCLKCGTSIRPQTPREIAGNIYINLSRDESFQLFAPVSINSSADYKYVVEKAAKEGFSKVRINGEILDIKNIGELPENSRNTIELVGDIFSVPGDFNITKRDEFINTVTDSIKKLLSYAKYTLVVEGESGKSLLFTTKLICPVCHSSFPELSSQHFSFNTPLGMCPNCGGLGIKQTIDPDLLLGDPNISILDGAIRWFGNLRDGKKTTWPTGPLDVLYNHYGLDLETPWKDLPKWFHDIIFYGSGEEKLKYPSTLGGKDTYKPVNGLVPELTRLYYETESEATRKKYGEYMNSEPCKVCEGTRLCVEARSVRLANKTISEVSSMAIDEAIEWIKEIYEHVDDSILEISEELIMEIFNRLSFLTSVGLHYLTLNRTAPTLSGGEGQRVRLASQLSSGIVGVLYVLDEPSIGLHPRDLTSLLKTLVKLRDQGNTVLVVEHEEEIMRNADWLVDIGPKAGVLGGQIMAQGTPEKVINNPNSITGKYLSGTLEVGTPALHSKRKEPSQWLLLEGVKQNNLKNVTARFPIGRMTCITGVSGSGKSSLIGETLEPLLEKLLNGGDSNPGTYEKISGYDSLERIINVSQDPIGRTPRSNPATYTDVFDKIRKVFSNTLDARNNNLKYEHFSFNSPKGRCEVCEGQGQIKIEMHFLADVWITCTECKGKRFKSDILVAKFKDKSIADVLDMDVDEALELFEGYSDIERILETLRDVGLEYIKLGQSATTLSGGEAQRVKLAKELSKKIKGKMIYILDEPTTGLHFNDIQHLLNIFHRLVNDGHTLIVIEHNLDVIKTADWIIDLGPEGGKDGGEIIAQATPGDLINIEKSYTGRALKKMLKICD